MKVFYVYREPHCCRDGDPEILMAFDEFDAAMLWANDQHEALTPLERERWAYGIRSIPKYTEVIHA